MEVPAYGSALSTDSQICHPAACSSKAQRISILAIATILAVGAGIAGSLVGIGAACGIALGAFVLSTISLYYARKYCCIPSVEAPTLLPSSAPPPPFPPTLHSANPPILSFVPPQFAQQLITQFGDKLSGFLVNVQPVGVSEPQDNATTAPANLSQSLCRQMLILNHKYVADILKELNFLKSSQDIKAFLSPIFEEYKNEPQKFVFLAGLFAIHGAQNKIPVYVIYNFLESLPWHSEVLKAQELPMILSNMLVNSMLRANTNVLGKTESHGEPFYYIGIQSDLLVGCLQINANFVSTIVKTQLDLIIRHEIDSLVQAWQTGKLGLKGIWIDCTATSAEMPYSFLALLLPEFAKLPGILRWFTYSEASLPYNQPFQLEGQDGFCDADIENLLALARRHPYLQFVWNGSKMSADGFAKFSEELNKILAECIVSPSSEQLLTTAQMGALPS